MSKNNCQFSLYTHISIGSLITDAKVPLNNDKQAGNHVTWLIHSKNSEIKIFKRNFNSCSSKTLKKTTKIPPYQ